MFIVSLHYLAPLTKVDAYIPEHIAFLDEHYAKGHFLLSGRKEPRTGGVILANVDSRDMLDCILVEDPFFREKLARYEITEIIPGKACAELGFLLTD